MDHVKLAYDLTDSLPETTRRRHLTCGDMQGDMLGRFVLALQRGEIQAQGVGGTDGAVVVDDNCLVSSFAVRREKSASAFDHIRNLAC